mgnify:CR=1 FL=1
MQGQIMHSIPRFIASRVAVAVEVGLAAGEPGEQLMKHPAVPAAMGLLRQNGMMAEGED